MQEIPAMCRGCRWVETDVRSLIYGACLLMSYTKRSRPVPEDGRCPAYDASPADKRTDLIYGEKYRQPRRQNWGLYAQIEALYREGKSDGEISRELNCGVKTVRHWRESEGFQSNYRR